MNNEELLKELSEKKKLVYLGGGLEKIEKQHRAGKLTVWERIEILLDKNSFVPLGQFVLHRCTEFGLEKEKVFGDGVVTGLGRINNRPVAIYAQDFTFKGGSVGEMHAHKIAKTIDLAIKLGVPLIGLNDSGGARIQEGVDSLKGYGEIFYRNVLASGIIPQITVIMGPCAGGAVYSPALADFIIMVDKTSYMFVTGPKVVKAAIGEDVTFNELGGAFIHATKSGVAHFIAKDEYEAISIVKKLLSYLPSNNLDDPPYVETDDDPFREESQLNNIVPSDPLKTYDMRKIITLIVDKNTFFEVHEHYARNAIIGFARLNGLVVGIVANQPLVYGGVLDIDASDKISRFIRFLDAFNIPLITFVDVPGFMPGTAQEHRGIIRHGAKIIYAYSESSIPKITVIVRKAYGGAYIAMGSKHLGTDIVFAWPTAEIAVMGPKGAIEIIYRKKLAKAENKDELIEMFVKEYRKNFTNPYFPASRGYIDDVIVPSETRGLIIKCLEFLLSKREKKPSPPKKHGIPPV
ncbi:MAG: methylmalonyl-CoA carboxyltransferase [Candidatus Aenigmatarchaeota archaeon]|nr:MAG: methylmalonyl-CoA carboxyltransferase [Candidatus Aenigmarchaeota archaeon]